MKHFSLEIGETNIGAGRKKGIHVCSFSLPPSSFQSPQICHNPKRRQQAVSSFYFTLDIVFFMTVFLWKCFNLLEIRVLKRWFEELYVQCCLYFVNPFIDLPVSLTRWKVLNLHVTFLNIPCFQRHHIWRR